MAKLKLDLHDLYNHRGEIDAGLNRIVQEALAKKIELVEITFMSSIVWQVRFRQKAARDQLVNDGADGVRLNVLQDAQTIDTPFH
jgi:hypothetical protein